MLNCFLINFFLYSIEFKSVEYDDHTNLSSLSLALNSSVNLLFTSDDYHNITKSFSLQFF